MRFGKFPYVALIATAWLAARAQEIHILSTQGSVSVVRGDRDNPIPRDLHATLVTGDRIVTGEKSQAEVRVDADNVLHIGPGTEVQLADVYPGRCQMVLAKGRLDWQVWYASAIDSEVLTPSVGARPRQTGLYGFAIDDKGETEIVAKAGNIEVFAPTGSEWVKTGQKMLARGPASEPEFQIGSASAPVPAASRRAR